MGEYISKNCRLADEAIIRQADDAVLASTYVGAMVSLVMGCTKGVAWVAACPLIAKSCNRIF